ncbi:ThiF family adenylyltransferase [Desulfobacter latus]|uniref:ThiF family adenylyltransferase n=1 Tax=Desulfobacter latus TaxID=2292 RepID=A0A850TAT9_9BACT|nr:ThiF family adenylyltransferase [Desulfobacter latus]NWH05718.1 ThiF family adenylyltransferase [Desulfobacter latus]
MKRTAGEKAAAFICDQDLLELAGILNVSLHQMYLQSMEKGILPLRYLRNMPSISLTQQISLQKSRVAVVGAGGLGGRIIEGLCRLGVGALHIFDPDSFDETNLNRQIFADQNSLGNPKVEVMQECCRLINPAVQITAHRIAVTDQNQDALFADVQVIVDALDTPGDRLTLAAIAGKCRLPLVHGTVAGFGGRVMVIHPLDGRMEMLYGGQEDACSAEHQLGTPVLSPALIASFQMMAVLNLLLGKNQAGDSRMIYADMEKPSLDLFEL